MPVTDLSGGDDDWLQQFLAGHQAGQAFGASQPYGAGAVPGPYSGGPQGLMPGGGVMARQGATLGAPSMGYPAMGQATAQQPPATAPGPAQGLSLTNNPIMHALSALNPIGSANAATDPRLGSSVTMNRSQPLPPGAANSLPLTGAPTGQDYQNWLTSQLSGTAPGASPAATTTAVPSGRNPPWFTPSNNPLPWRQDPSGLPKSDPSAPPGRRTYVGQPPGQGAPTGQPSQTPTPPQGSQSARFGTVQYGVPGEPGSTNAQLSRNPIYTTFNLFGGQRGQPGAANPANVPAANAQPVSAQAPVAGPLASNAPWGMGPLQQGMHWPYGPNWRDLAAAHSGYQ